MGLHNHLSIFLVLEPCDMRKSFNGLAALTEELKPAALKNGGLFLFTNKRRNRFKALFVFASHPNTHFTFNRMRRIILFFTMVNSMLFGHESTNFEEELLEFMYSHGSPSDDFVTVYEGHKHRGIPYYVNTFLRFKATKPRQ